MKPDIQNIIKAFRQLETICHSDDWTQVKVEEITALCDEIERVTPKFEVGDRIKVIYEDELYKGAVVSRSTHKAICPQYGIFTLWPHGWDTLYFSEEQIQNL